MRISEDPVDQRRSVGPILPRDAFQALLKGELWVARLIRREKAASDAIDGLRDAGLHLVYLGRGKDSCADGIATRGDGHGVPPSQEASVVSADFDPLTVAGQRWLCIIFPGHDRRSYHYPADVI